MKKITNQKARLLVLKEIFEHETDDKTFITVKELEQILECERKAIYDDFKLLEAMDFEINSIKKGQTTYYYHIDKEFEESELKLLTDAVRSTTFISDEQTEKLVDKIKNLAGPSFREKLNRQLYSRKSSAISKNVFISIDALYGAIDKNDIVTFKYYKWNSKREFIEKHPNMPYLVYPITLAWVDDFYYLVGYDLKTEDNKIKHFRVDKIRDVNIACDAKIPEAIKNNKVDISSYLSKNFKMFSTDRDYTISLICKKGFMENVIIDNFGTQVSLIDIDENRFKCFINVFPSDSFLSYLIGFGDNVEVEGPPIVRDRIKTLAEKVYKIYN